MSSLTDMVDKLREQLPGGGSGYEFQLFAILESITAGAIGLAKALCGVPGDTPNTEFLCGVYFSVVSWYILRKTQILQAAAGAWEAGQFIETASAAGEGVGANVPLT